MALYKDVRASLIKFCAEKIVSMNLEGSWAAFDFDAHASLNDLPEANLLGIAELGLLNQQGTYHFTVSLVVCTLATDEGIKDLVNMVDELESFLRPGVVEVKVVDATNGFLKGNLVVQDGVSILPVASTKSRPLQVLAVRFGSSFVSPP